MSSTCQTPYKLSRLHAGMTQEAAAEVIPISIRSLSDYESGRTIPPDDVVERMVDVYETGADKQSWLAWEHLRMRSIVARRLFPKVEMKPIAEATLELLCLEESLARAIRIAAIIAKDGKITPDEREQFQEVSDVLQQAVSASMEVILQG